MIIDDIITFSSSIMLEKLPACFPFNKYLNPLENSLGSDDKNLAFEKGLFLWYDETPEAETIIPGDLAIL